MHQVVLHDTDYLDKIYAVLDFRLLAEQGMSDGAIEAIKDRTVQEEKKKILAILRALHQRGPQNPKEHKVFNLFRDVKEENKFLAAQDRVRSQQGLRERFAAGIQVSRRYLPAMEAIFRAHGLPVQLTRLPLIESCFNVRAYSKAGAAGIWQFIPSTGRLYLRIDHVVDERRDPLLSTRAAAKLLKENYEIFGNWPLAITAYNHGQNGIGRAVQAVGSHNLIDILQHYKGPRFGFASKNFYAEFLAALEVEGRYREFFGDLPLHPPLAFDEVAVQDFVDVRTAAGCAGTTPEILAELNPALDSSVFAGKAYIPRGYSLRIPSGSQALFLARYAQVAPAQKSAGQKTQYVLHRVRRGQTLSHIARRYGISVAAIKKVNGLRSEHRIRAGQTLRIPPG